MRDFDKSFRRMQFAVGCIFAVVIVVMVCYFAFLGFAAYKAVTLAEAQDWSGGLKPVIERLWCGSPGCLK
jgi:hypothetical protein